MSNVSSKSKCASAESTTSSTNADSKRSSLISLSSKSIVLEKNGEKKILKKIKLKTHPKTPVIKSLTPEIREKDAKKFVCTFCPSTFSSHDHLRIHFLKHGNQANDSRQTFEGSERSRSSHEPAIVLIECEWCPETFTSMSKAIEHKYRKHNYESKNYFCTLCGRLFPLKVALEQHQSLEHANDKEINVPRLDYICGFCGTAFISHSALALHIKTAHNLEKRMIDHPFVPIPSKKVRLNQAGEIFSIYYCHLCGSEYMVKFNLLKHIEDHHSFEERCAAPEELLKCSTCDSMFYTKKAFDTHNIHHKPEDLYATSEEHRLHIVARVDQDYDFRRVPTAIDKALGSLAGSSGSNSATTLAKNHRKKTKKGIVSSSRSGNVNSGDSSSSSTGVTTSTDGVTVLDLNQINVAEAGSFEAALSVMLGE
ncbi:zinc finger protein 808-like [Sabethes cyaneus]|uniref:zinc finger protein 808-like n=1 Tax=Sabethes cyaneus TaxID=53552 RepID=UPI00237E3235|nr:zinc finger protein 808-like [Sabethes cyaneus]